MSSLRLLNTEIVSEGLVTGVDEVYIETTLQYVATDIHVLQSERDMATEHRIDEWLEEFGDPLEPQVDYQINPIDPVPVPEDEEWYDDDVFNTETQQLA